jgi:hypothetical protein
MESSKVRPGNRSRCWLGRRPQAPKSSSVPRTRRHNGGARREPDHERPAVLPVVVRSDCARPASAGALAELEVLDAELAVVRVPSSRRWRL